MSIKRMSAKLPTYASQQRGAMLLEALIAIVVFSMGVLAVAGLQASMVTNTTEASMRAEATYIAQKVVGNMWASPDTVASFVGESDISESSGLPNGVLKVERFDANPNQVRVTVTWQREGGDSHQVVTNARITGDVIQYAQPQKK